MKTLSDFNRLSTIDEYLDFFEIDANNRIINGKRFHILKLFGASIEKLKPLAIADENRLLEIYRFALLNIVKRFEEGFNPSAAEIWGALEKPSSCLACSLPSCSGDVST
ncbi:MAG: nitrogenase-stabilizing/protective protein NifW [Helicobacteraceae bacterium]|jgi:nitrogenase-stabilizing/protective protein|nr:nitrogenase-stabilizing/protective protein NifW [Helicobacteraceae bacterium]